MKVDKEEGNDSERPALRSWTFQLPRGRTWQIESSCPGILGVLNVTPDSFSDGGRYYGLDDAVQAGLGLLAEGADALDIGGESTRPGAPSVPASEQIRRVVPVLRKLRTLTDLPLSVDTTLPEVAAEALAAGADVVNDVAGFGHPGWQDVLLQWPVPMVLMHMQGTPRDMQTNPSYPEGVVGTVREFFQDRLNTLAQWGVSSERVILDPGVGFGKQLQHNLDLIRNMEQLRVSGCPLLAGLSRKSFIGKVLDRDVNERDVGTVAANAAALFAGADILRVHNVAYTRDLVRMLVAIRHGRCLAEDED